MRDGRYDLARRELVLPQVQLTEGDVRVFVSETGTMNWEDLFGGDTPTREDDAQRRFTTRIEQLQLQDVDLDYVDRSRARPLHVNADGLDGGADLLLVLGGPSMQFSGSEIRMAAERLVIHDRQDKRPPALAADQVAFEGGTFDFARRRIVFPGLSLAKGELRFAVDRSGAMNWQELFAEPAGAAKAASGAATAPASATADAGEGDAGDPGSWEILFPRMRAAALALEYVDRSRRAPLEARVASVDGGLDLAIVPAQSNGPILLDNIRLSGTRTSVGQVGAREPALELASVRTAGGSFASDALVLSGLRLRKGDLRVRVGEDGRSNWENLLADVRDKAPGETGEGAARDPLAVRLPGLRIDDIALHYADASRVQPLAVQAASIDAAASLSLTGQGLQAQQASASMRGFTLGPRGEPPAIRLARIEASGARVGASGMRLERVRLIDGHARLALNEDGTLNLQRLMQARGGADPSRPNTQSGPGRGSAGDGFGFRADAVALQDLSVDAVDRSRAQPVALTAKGIGGQFALQVGGGGEVRVGDAKLQAGPMRMAFVDADAPLTTLNAMTLSGGRLNTAQRQVGVDALSLSGGSVRVVRQEDGSIPLMQAVAGTSQAPGSKPAVPAATQTAVRKQGGWNYALGQARIQDVEIALADRSFGEPIAYQVSVDGTLRRLNSDAPSGGAVDLRLDAKPGGKASVSGTLAGTSQPMKLRVDVEGFPLQPLQPVLSRYASLELKSGSLDAQAVLATGSKQDDGIRVTGSVDVASLRLDEATTGERFLAWKRLHAQSIHYDTSRNRLVVGRAVLDGADAHLEISREGELNFRQLLRDSDGKAGQAAQAASSTSASVAERAGSGAERPQASPAARDEGAFEALVDRLRVRDSTLRFADRSLVIPFVADITQFSGTMVSLSTRPKDRAQLQFDGRVQPYGAARVSGSIRLAAPREFTDIRAEFNNVPLPKLSPYTITFAGRAIAEGTLWLDLDYRIVDGDLVGENEITMQNLRLGERVEAPRALDLPLELAMALLTDDQGVLNLRVPVRGDLDNPTFDYSTVIRKAVTGTLRRVVTAPFRFIGRLFGPDVEELDAIEFEPGSASLRPPEEEKLEVVAKSLAERPALELEVQGTFSPEEDARALRAAALEAELAQRMKLELSEGESMGPVAFGQTATQLALEEMFVAQFGEDAAEALRGRLGREQDSAVQRVDREAGDPIAAAGDPDLYRAMFDRLVETRPVDPQALRQLAARRTDAVLDYVVRQAGVSEQRLAIAATATVQAEENLVPTQLRLNVGAAGKNLPLDLETVDKVQPEEREAEPASADAATR